MAYVSTSFNPNAHPKKSTTAKFKENVAFMLVGAFIIYFIQRFFSFLFSPFKSETIGTEEYIEERQKAREDYLDEVAEDESDPMYQFQERFLEHPENHLRDPDNKAYKTWYENWRNGEVPDTYLRWVPDMYNSNGREMRANFIEYMKIQLTLHKKESVLTRMNFLKTIRKYYPEFTATFRGLENDLARYETMVIEETLKKSLTREINKFGLPENLAEYLVEQDLSVEDLRKKAEFVKPLAKKGFSNTTCICAIENNLNEEEAKVIEHVVVKMELPRRVAIAFLRNEIDSKGLEKVYETAIEVRQHAVDLDQDIFAPWKDDKSYYDYMIDHELTSLKGQKRARRYS